MTVMVPMLPPVGPPPLVGPALPRYGEPGWTVWSRRVWPIDPVASAPRRVVVLAVVAGLIGTALWRPSASSVGYLVVGVLFFAVVYGTAEQRPTRWHWLGMVLTSALLAVPALLAAGWLNQLCVMSAWVVGACTLMGGRTWTAVFTGPFLPWALAARIGGWVRRSVPRGARLPHVGRAAAVAAATVVLALVFGGLFAAADPAFAHLAGQLVPRVHAADVVARPVVFAMVSAFVLAGAYLMRFPPRLDAMAPAPMRSLRRWEWAVPLGVLDVLFTAFVAVQFAVLFGGHDHVLQTEGLTYAEYARQGFWQLLWVSALTLVVLSGVVRLAGRATAADRALLRALVGTLCATSVVVVISAIHRMWLYQQAYGFSVLRLMVITTEVWLGTIFLLVAATGIRMTGRWIPRAVLVAGVLALLGLAVLNPERLIAERNIDRFEQTGQLDVQYLSGLSSDIDPVLQRLPESVRACVKREEQRDDPWYLFNLSRARADRSAPAELPASCDAYWPYSYYR